jgi:hypothetical protein
MKRITDLFTLLTRLVTAHEQLSQAHQSIAESHRLFAEAMDRELRHGLIVRAEVLAGNIVSIDANVRHGG